MKKSRWHPLYWAERGMWSWHSGTWDDILKLSDYQAGLRTVVRALEGARRRPDERVLDLGCGTGNYSLAVARAGYEVVGTDFAPGMLRKARRKVDQPGLRATIRRVDFNAPLPFPDASFDHALCIAAMQCIADPAAFLREVRRVVRPGGTFIGVFRDTALRENYLAQRLHITQSSKPRTWSLILRIKARAGRSGWAQQYTEPQVRGYLADAGFEVLERHPFYRNTIGLHARSTEAMAGSA